MSHQDRQRPFHQKHRLPSPWYENQPEYHVGMYEQPSSFARNWQGYQHHNRLPPQCYNPHAELDHASVSRGEWIDHSGDRRGSDYSGYGRDWSRNGYDYSRRGDDYGGSSRDYRRSDARRVGTYQNSFTVNERKRFYEENARESRRDQRIHGAEREFRNHDSNHGDSFNHRKRECSPLLPRNNWWNRETDGTNFHWKNRRHKNFTEEDPTSVHYESSRSRKNYNDVLGRDNHCRGSEREQFHSETPNNEGFDWADYMKNWTKLGVGTRWNGGSHGTSRFRNRGGFKQRRYRRRKKSRKRFLPRHVSPCPVCSSVPEIRPPYAGGPFRKSTCLNCGKKGHITRGCMEPKNEILIAYNRFRMEERSQRYTDFEDYSDYKPGLISEQLRKSLGLEERQLPKFIYKMRTFGYPRAWLKEAITPKNTIVIVDFGKKDSVDHFSDVRRFDTGKFISFPGFNTPAPPGTIDQSEFHCAPAFNEEQSLELMKKVLEEKRLKPKRNYLQGIKELIKDCGEGSLQEVNKITEKGSGQDEGSLEGKGSSKVGLQEVDKITEKGSGQDDGSLREGLRDGEVMLASSVECSKPLEYGSHENREMAKTVYYHELESQNDSVDKFDLEERNKNISPTTSVAYDCKTKCKIVDLGPEVNSLSPFKSLPPMSNFALGINDVINFRNLPQLTDNYKKIKLIFEKIKTIKKQY